MLMNQSRKHLITRGAEIGDLGTVTGVDHTPGSGIAQLLIKVSDQGSSHLRGTGEWCHRSAHVWEDRSLKLLKARAARTGATAYLSAERAINGESGCSLAFPGVLVVCCNFSGFEHRSDSEP